MGKPVRAWQGKWRLKESELPNAEYAFLVIRAEKRIQGVTKLIIAGSLSNSPYSHGRPLVYVDFLESAPWNVKRYMDVLNRKQRFKDVGRELMRAAVHESFARGFDGLVGLHSLPEAEGFYEELGMTRLAPDLKKGTMVYYEISSQQARNFYGDTI